MNGLRIWLIAGAAAVVAVAALVTLLVVRRRSDAGQKRRVKGVLKKYAALRGYKVVSDVTLDGGKGTYHVDNILVGYFGLLFVHVCTENLDFYGEERDENWSMVNEDKAIKIKFSNPLNVNLGAMDALRRNCAKNHIYNIQMEQVVVFTSRFKKNSFNIKESLPVINVRKFGGMLGKSHFEKDHGVDVEIMLRMIDQTRAR